MQMIDISLDQEPNVANTCIDDGVTLEGCQCESRDKRHKINAICNDAMMKWQISHQAFWHSLSL